MFFPLAGKSLNPSTLPAIPRELNSITKILQFGLLHTSILAEFRHVVALQDYTGKWYKDCICNDHPVMVSPVVALPLLLLT